MRVIAVGNSKGGVGKTTTVANLGHGLALAGHRVLAVDLDSQGNLAPVLGLRAWSLSLYHVLVEGRAPGEAIILARPGGHGGRLDILPGDVHSAEAKDILAAKIGRDMVLSRRLADLPRAYDFVLLDCAPSLDLLNTMALLYATEILIPVGCRGVDLHGVSQYLGIAKEIVQVFNHPLRLLAVLPTFYDQRTSEAKAVLDMLHRHYPQAVAEPIRQNVRLAEAGARGQSIFEYDRGSYGARDYGQLVALLARGTR